MPTTEPSVGEELDFSAPPCVSLQGQTGAVSSSPQLLHCELGQHSLIHTGQWLQDHCSPASGNRGCPQTFSSLAPEREREGRHRAIKESEKFCLLPKEVV